MRRRLTRAFIAAWNPRYANYARAHGRTPAEQVDQDSKAWPGGHMTGFVLWNTFRLRKAAKDPAGLLYGQHRRPRSL
ncbi:hypothetical protein [Mesorhizobium sp. L2C084A000]|uniref:hypothetical protein n=1 Tax=Mesorhizobium sp. L2C084A000 TaxID=1287116 RepID=UPI0003CFFC9E|nr:hypothetical protein [Mesorhizobium sp. L2C084A000]ESZ30432.1 hypothetical protein X734_03980 [Mesorhizobium sp. L2C084A000]